LSTTSTYGVAGMTCGHCVAAVTEELTGVPGVIEVDVDLVAGGVSTVRVVSDRPVDDSAVADSVVAAGYELAGRPA
jgi:copper chaperone CopZ